MRGLEELGVINSIGELTANMIRSVPEGDGRLAFAIVLILWVSAFVSAFVDNIPFVAAMIHVVVALSKVKLNEILLLLLLLLLLFKKSFFS
jgi:Na+/H+ antiporter NhaD/arsenite permease-like protein